jgi:hypothetical protein
MPLKQSSEWEAAPADDPKDRAQRATKETSAAQSGGQRRREQTAIGKRLNVLLRESPIDVYSGGMFESVSRNLGRSSQQGTVGLRLASLRFRALDQSRYFHVG